MCGIFSKGNTVLNIRCIFNQGQERKKSRITLTGVAEILSIKPETAAQELIMHFILTFHLNKLG